MKVRNGFVSNSSSSSFIIAKAYLTDIQVDGLRDSLKQLENSGNHKYGWSEDGDTYEETEKYFNINTYYIYSEINKVFQKFNINWNDGITVEG